MLDCGQDRSSTVDGVTPSLTTAIFNLGFTAHTLASVRVDPSDRRDLVIFDKNGDRTRIPDVVNPGRIVGSRARADGFLVALSDASVAGELLQVAFDGTAVKIGEYAPFPGGLLPTGTDYITGTAPYRVSAIDRDGVLFQLATGHDRSGPTYVVRRPLAPAPATVVYDATGKPVTLGGNGPSYRTLVTGP